MDTGILWSLVGSFTNVFLLTRALQYFLKKTKLEDRKRAYIVFFSVGIVDLIGLMIAFRDRGISSAVYYWLFFFAPFLVMWLFKDLMEVSRKTKERQAAELMSDNSIIKQTEFEGVPSPVRGKVRDIYDLGNELLIVVTDRISAYDVIMEEGIPGKGVVLNQISKFWFAETSDIVKNHVISTEVNDFPEEFHKFREVLEGRSMLVKKTKPLPVECVVRGYVAGSGWKEYQESQTICGIKLPPGVLESGKLEDPIFTPATKAEMGDHDENITFEKAAEIIGIDVAEKVREISIALYSRARNIADRKGIIIADTKFEFGTDAETGDLILIDEALTPDSSRFWPKDEYESGRPQKSFDKQFVRDYLTSLNWDKTPPPPHLPPEVIAGTSEKYREALSILTG